MCIGFFLCQCGDSEIDLFYSMVTIALEEWMSD